MNAFRAAPVVAMLLVAQCATTQQVGPQVSIPMTCENHLKPVAIPAPKLNDDDVKIAATYRATAVSANHVIVNGRDCIKGVRLGFAKKL